MFGLKKRGTAPAEEAPEEKKELGAFAQEGDS